MLGVLEYGSKAGAPSDGLVPGAAALPAAGAESPGDWNAVVVSDCGNRTAGWACNGPGSNSAPITTNMYGLSEKTSTIGSSERQWYDDTSWIREKVGLNSMARAERQ